MWEIASVLRMDLREWADFEAVETRLKVFETFLEDLESAAVILKSDIGAVFQELLGRAHDIGLGGTIDLSGYASNLVDLDTPEMRAFGARMPNHTPSFGYHMVTVAAEMVNMIRVKLADHNDLALGHTVITSALEFIACVRARARMTQHTPESVLREIASFSF